MGVRAKLLAQLSAPAVARLASISPWDRGVHRAENAGARGSFGGSRCGQPGSYGAGVRSRAFLAARATQGARRKRPAAGPGSGVRHHRGVPAWLAEPARRRVRCDHPRCPGRVPIIGAVPLSERGFTCRCWPAVLCVRRPVVCARGEGHERRRGGAPQVASSAPWPAWKRVAVLAASGAVALLGWVTGPAPLWGAVAVVFVRLLPAAFTALAGGWLCLLVHRKVRALPGRWRSHAGDVLLAVVTGLALQLLARPDLLGRCPQRGCYSRLLPGSASGPGA